MKLKNLEKALMCIAGKNKLTVQAMFAKLMKIMRNRIECIIKECVPPLAYELTFIPINPKQTINENELLVETSLFHC